MCRESFDDPRRPLRRLERIVLGALRAGGLIAALFARPLVAQMPSAPVLQNAWATPGIVAAFNVAGGSGGVLYAAAASWSPEAGRFQVSAGAGYESVSRIRSLNDNAFSGRTSGAHSSGAVGVRIAAPVGNDTRNVGVAPFIGVGGGGRNGRNTTVIIRSPSTVIVEDTTANGALFVVGAGFGARRLFGGNRGVAIYATPAYVYYSGGSNPVGLFRSSVGVDIAPTATFGFTAGIEFGQNRSRAVGGPNGALGGVGISYVVTRF